MRTAVLIPARYFSSRFEGKALADIAGKTMIRRVYEGVAGSKLADLVAVLTDDERIKSEVESFGGKAFIVKGNFASGTDRIAYFAKDKPFDYIVNMQGDEPLIDSETIDSLIRCITESRAPMVTLASRCEEELVDDPNTVKVITDTDGYAIYFSRSRIPFNRNTFSDYMKHIGIYAYTKPTLMKLYNLREGKLERAEGLEQLRAIENNISIKVYITDKKLIGVDTPDDLNKVVEYLKGKDP